MFGFIGTQFAHIPKPTESFEGQTIIVTGSNTGLGLEAARHFASLNAKKVILACRSTTKGEAAALSIEQSTGRPGVCEVWELDMSSYDSIKAFSKRAAGLDRLDVVLENAGVAHRVYYEKEGTEETIAVNVIGTFLLALNMLPLLRASGRKNNVLPRLVVVSSEVHGWSPFEERLEANIFEALAKNDPKYMANRYPTSKLLEVLTIRELAARMNSGSHANEKVVLNSVNPGLCHSSLSREIDGIRAIFFSLFKLLIARSTEVGARTLVASAIAGEDSHGKYMSECKVAEPSVFVRSEEGKITQQRVYDELMALLEKIQPGVTKNI